MKWICIYKIKQKAVPSLKLFIWHFLRKDKFDTRLNGFLRAKFKIDKSKISPTMKIEKCLLSLNLSVESSFEDSMKKKSLESEYEIKMRLNGGTLPISRYSEKFKVVSELFTAHWFFSWLSATPLAYAFNDGAGKEFNTGESHRFGHITKINAPL